MFNLFLHEQAVSRQEEIQKNRKNHFGLTEEGQDAMGMLKVDREDRENKASIARGRFSDLAEQQILQIATMHEANKTKQGDRVSVHETFRPKRRISLEMAHDSVIRGVFTVGSFRVNQNYEPAQIKARKTESANQALFLKREAYTSGRGFTKQPAHARTRLNTRDFTDAERVRATVMKYHFNGSSEPWTPRPLQVFRTGNAMDMNSTARSAKSDPLGGAPVSRRLAGSIDQKDFTTTDGSWGSPKPSPRRLEFGLGSTGQSWTLAPPSLAVEEPYCDENTLLHVSDKPQGSSSPQRKRGTAKQSTPRSAESPRRSEMQA